MSEQAAPIRYSRGKNKYDAHPRLHCAADFAAFEHAVMGDRARVKGRQYVCGPLKPNGNGTGHRCKDDLLPRLFFALDVDKIAGAQVYAELRLWLARWRGFGYTTARHMPDKPRCRAIVELSREITREEGERLGAQIICDLEEEFGANVGLDKAQHLGEQPIYTPLTSAETFRLEGDALDVDAILSAIPASEDRPTTAPAIEGRIPEGARSATLTSMAGSMRRRGMTHEAIEVALLAENAARCSPPLLEAEVKRIAASVARYIPNESPAREVKKPPASDVALLADDEVLIQINQDNVATVFAQRFAGRLRFSHDRGRWYLWDGTRWREEQTQLAFDWTRRLTHKLNIEGKREFAKAAFCEGVEKFARADRVFAMRGDEWDADPLLLNTPDGTVDLRTGEMRPPRQEDLITKCTRVGPAAGVPHLWLEFLRQATEGDDELIAFLQRVAGYCLSGDTREECLFFLYGTGGNGKGTFVGALFNILGEDQYAANSPMETFLASRYERHSTDLAMLRGARMVTASETTEGRAWDEQRIKAMTGNDPITARFMRQDNFTYQPQFKLLLLGNNKPVLHSVDEAWRRRFNIIPFTHSPARRDGTLKKRLRAEYPQILEWAIEGHALWEINGLEPPKRVLAETAVYFESQDTFANWLEDCCTIEPGLVETNAELFKSWAMYCEKHHEQSGTGRSFVDRLATRGFLRFKNEFGLRGRGWCGLKVIPLSDLDGA